jgi:5-methylcytosine-specific restriction endonuclease McrA
MFLNAPPFNLQHRKPQGSLRDPYIEEIDMSLPNYNTLVLNADFQPVRIHPLSVWAFDRAMRAVISNRVTVLEEYDVEFRSANLTYRPPSVVALKRYVRVPERVAFNRINIFLRDDFKCQYCGEEFSTRDLTFDHVIPRCRNGRDAMDNVVAACGPCNSKKGDKIWQPRNPPRIPDPREMAKKAMKRKSLIKGLVRSDWLSYLYWSGVLEEDQ